MHTLSNPEGFEMLHSSDLLSSVNAANNFNYGMNILMTLLCHLHSCFSRLTKQHKTARRASYSFSLTASHKYIQSISLIKDSPDEEMKCRLRRGVRLREQGKKMG